MRKILEKEFLATRISKLLTMTIAKNEFSNTFVKNNLNYNESQTESKKSLAITSQEETKEGGNE